MDGCHMGGSTCTRCGIHIEGGTCINGGAMGTNRGGACTTLLSATVQPCASRKRFNPPFFLIHRLVSEESRPPKTSRNFPRSKFSSFLKHSAKAFASSGLEHLLN